MAFDVDALVRLVHILGGILWLGGGAFMLLMIQPAVAAAGPAGGAVMMKVLKRGGLGKWFGPVGIVTILAGLWMYVRGDYHADPFGSTSSTILTLGVLLALVAWLEGMFVAMPIEVKMKALAKSMPADGPPNPEQMAHMQALIAKNVRAGRHGVILISLAFLAMAGRFVFT